ncbi:HAD family hydrolase [Microbacterium marmarense]|uniref:HAD family hydrolase n=1 Tax=Microbacterium marmarense TaxID=3122051 RepID=A0ABU8LR71_9MICO
MASPRIAFLDVDGTILDHGKTIARSTIDAVRSARAAGHYVYLSTGRAAGDIHPDVLDIGFDGAISNGGAYATVGDLSVVANPMPRAAVDELITYMDAAGILYLLQTNAAVYASPHVQKMLDDLTRSWMASHGDEDTPQTAPQEVPRFGDIADIDLTQVAKAVFLSDQTDAVERAQADLKDRFHVVAGSMPLPGGSNGEIGMRGTTKGSAILSVLTHLAIEPSAAISIGDSWNDVEMFEVCGVGIAMGNAPAALKQLADEVTTSVRDDGIWNAFRKHGLI